jgi:peptidoglycan/LPS O-acetylase OafA/YrhL
MRTHFVSRLALLLVAAFLVLASQVWLSGTIEWLFIVGGIAMILLAAADMADGDVNARRLDAVIGLLGVWSIVEAIAFDGSDLKWISFATALAGAVLAVIGLALHESSTERVVHELTVTPREAAHVA